MYFEHEVDRLMENIDIKCKRVSFMFSTTTSNTIFVSKLPWGIPCVLKETSC